MSKAKIIWDYFEMAFDYPQAVAHDPLPYGTVWNYISSTFLNGFINYVSPVSVIVLDRYTPGTKDLSAEGISIKDKGVPFQWHHWMGTKAGLATALINGEKEMYHTHMNCFQDDIVVLAKIEGGGWMFFWFDCDGSDCSIGRFNTTDPEEHVIQSIRAWLAAQVKENNGVIMKEDTDNGICGYTELPVTFLSGWVRF